MNSIDNGLSKVARVQEICHENKMSLLLQCSGGHCQHDKVL